MKLKTRFFEGYKGKYESLSLRAAIESLGTGLTTVPWSMVTSLSKPFHQLFYLFCLVTITAECAAQLLGGLSQCDELVEDDTKTTVYFFVRADGTERSSGKCDCDDYALALQQRASKDGYLMSVAIIEKNDQPYMINLVTIGNDVYYIEPQTDEVWFYSHLD